MKTIFLTNDDGYNSKGLLDLRNALSEIARVVVVAPANEKSACGHGLCVSRPMQLIEIEQDFYKLDDGTPTDCVYVGLYALFPTIKPDLIVSGINIGANLGEDTTYSGTVAGAIEGVMHGVKSIAISQVIHDWRDEHNKIAQRDFSLALNFIKQLSFDVLDGKYCIGERKFLNVNVPAISKFECKGIKTTQLGYRVFSPSVQRFQNPRNQEYFWIGSNPMSWKERDNKDNLYIQDNNSIIVQQERELVMISDFEAVVQNYISITPMQLDNTSYSDFKNLNHYCETLKL